MKQLVLPKAVPKPPPVVVPRYKPGVIVLYVPPGHKRTNAPRIRITRILPPEKWQSPIIPIYGFEFIDPYYEPVVAPNSATVEALTKALSGEGGVVANPAKTVQALEFKRLRRS